MAVRWGVAAQAVASMIVGLAVAAGGCAVRLDDSGDGRASSPRTTRRAVQRPRPIAAVQPAPGIDEAVESETPTAPWGEEQGAGGMAAAPAPPLLRSEDLSEGGVAGTATAPSVIVRREDPTPAPEAAAVPSVDSPRRKTRPSRAATPTITVTRVESEEEGGGELRETVDRGEGGALAGARAEAPSAGYWVVMSRYRSAEQAAEHARSVRVEGFPARSAPLTMSGEVWYGVSVGPYETERDAVIAGQGLRARGHAAWMVEAAQ